MAKAWFPFYLNDYAADTVLLDLAEHGAYILLMSFYWNSDANAPASADRLHKVCRCTTDAERDAVDSVVEKFFTVNDGKLVNNRLDKELAKSASISASRRKAAKAKHAKDPASADASAEQVQTQSQSQSQSKDKPKSENKFSDEDMRFAKWVWERIKDLDPSRKEPDFDKWADVSRLMRERDKITHYDMGQVFYWANNDSFWKTNILSMAKFREKYSDLKIKMSNVPAVKKSKTTSEQIDEVMGGNNGSMDQGNNGSEPKIVNAAQIGFLPEG